MSSSTSGSEGTGRTPLGFAIRVLLFSLCAMLVVGLATLSGIPATRVDYLGGLKGKHDRLKELASPKVVIIGGSNATFGIDSEALEQALCMPVVNMAIHAGLNYRFMVNEVKNRLGKGDLVLVSLEYYNYSGTYIVHDIHYQTVDLYAPALKFIGWQHWPKAVMEVAVMRLQATWRTWSGSYWPMEEQVYRADGFNDRGDIVSHIGLGQDPSKLPFEPAGFEGSVSRDFRRAARDLEHHAEVAGARILYCWPALARSAYPGDTVPLTITAAMKDLGSRMIGSASDYILPDSSFLDTPYHLRPPGRDHRTHVLIRDLCEADPSLCCTAQE